MGYLNNKAVFTNEGLPQELVEINLLRDKKNYAEAETLKILKPSANRVQSRCGHFKACSIYQNINYTYQIEIKETQIKEIFLKNLGINLNNGILKPSPIIWGYRNKANLNVIWENDRAHLAYHKPGSFDKFVKVEECFLLNNKLNLKLAEMLKTINNEKLYNIKEAAVRENAYENIDNKKFSIGDDSFFQVNTAMLKELVKDIKKYLTLTGKETIADLYCGIGTFGILLSDSAKKIIGVELTEGNITFLKDNISLNNIENFAYYQGASENFLDKVLEDKPDIIIVDPPRKGLSPGLCETLVKKPIPTLLYISCDPATLARDLKILLNAYKLKNITCYDFFPHTPHIETMCVLSKS